ncbi:hypothetical protein ACFL3T_00285 [Patescibacteria group bacterium]
MPENKDQTPQDPKQDGNLYTNIFEKKAPGKEEKPQTTELIEGVNVKKEKEVTPDENILGPIPELEKKIVGAFDPTKRNLKIIKIAFISVIVLCVLSIGFFYTELTPSFDLFSTLRGPNTAQKLQNTNQEIITTQTSINQKNYLLMAFYLQELSYLSDTYAKARKDSVTDSGLADLQDRILLSYENAQTKYREPMKVANIPEEDFMNALKNELREEITLLKKEELTDTIIQDITNYSTALQLVTNKNLTKFFNKNTEDIKSDLERDDASLLLLTQEALDIVENNFSNVNALKQNRIKWSAIIEEIEIITKNEDSLYNTGFFEELGGIKYSSFDFDTLNNQVTIAGMAKRDDGTTFTLITNLIDSLEQSAMFKTVENRSYPKSGDEEKGYTSSFRIELILDNEYLTLV